jgi:hypothetical protein
MEKAYQSKQEQCDMVNASIPDAESIQTRLPLTQTVLLMFKDPDKTTKRQHPTFLMTGVTVLCGPHCPGNTTLCALEGDGLFPIQPESNIV